MYPNISALWVSRVTKPLTAKHRALEEDEREYYPLDILERLAGIALQFMYV